ncbi:MAG: DUF6198 family protein [Lachnospiraceae bacterium]|nr:DUF6198 family protein [Lachnospiraceae bacterium]
MRMKWMARWGFYLLGLVILALGIIATTKSQMGASPIISVAFTASQIWHLNFGNASLVMYVVIAGIEYLVKGKNFKLYDLLQIPLSILLTRLFNFFGNLLPDVHNIGASIFFLLIGIVCTGIGASMSMNARLVPNPGDGINLALADRTGKNAGLVKNCIDVFCVSLSVVICLIATHPTHVVGVGIATVCAMVGVGRVIAVYNHFFLQKTNEMMGMEAAAA